MESAEILKMIDDLIEYCKLPDATRKEIITQLIIIKNECNSVLPFD